MARVCLPKNTKTTKKKERFSVRDVALIVSGYFSIDFTNKENKVLLNQRCFIKMRLKKIRPPQKTIDSVAMD